jgi:hypothetical protein
MTSTHSLRADYEIEVLSDNPASVQSGLMELYCANLYCGVVTQESWICFNISCRIQNHVWYSACFSKCPVEQFSAQGLTNQICYRYVQKSLLYLQEPPPLNHILDHLIAVLTLPWSILIMTSHLYLGLWLPPSLGCSLTKVFFAFFISHACCIPHPSHLWFDNSNKMDKELWNSYYEFIYKLFQQYALYNDIKKFLYGQTVFQRVCVMATTILAATETCWNIVQLYSHFVK